MQQGLLNESLTLKSFKDKQCKVPRYISHGLCTETSLNYLIMEYFEVTLVEYAQKALENGQTDFGQLYVKMIEAVENFHASGWIHRDIKPSNFVLSGNDVYIIDFGTSR